jgi:hypothetical protein
MQQAALPVFGTKAPEIRCMRYNNEKKTFLELWGHVTELSKIYESA